MKASIIIPLYNQAEYVEEAIMSCIAQTHKDTDIIVVNDGSTDSSLLIAREHVKHPHVKVLNCINHSLGGARNAGALNSTGDVLLFLDADDFIAPNYLEKTIPLMTGAVGIVSTDMQYFGTHKDLIPTRKPTLSMEMEGNYLPVCSLIKREAFLMTGGYTTEVKIYEDWCLWIDLMKRGWEVAVVNEPLFFYRRKVQSMVTESEKPGMHQHLHNTIKKLHWDIFR